MKKLLVLFITLISISGYAQSNKEDVDLIQAIFGKEKKLIYTDFLKLDATQKDAFWKLYDEYETERKVLGKKRIEILERYVNSYATLDDATTSQIIKETASLGVENDKLISSYHMKFEKVSGAKVAGQFYQLEIYFLSAIRLSILESIPFIGELK